MKISIDKTSKSYYCINQIVQQYNNTVRDRTKEQVAGNEKDNFKNDTK